MKISQRFKAAAAAFTKKSATEQMTLNQLLDFLGVHDVTGEAMQEAVYYACNKVLSEAIGKLPLKVQQYTPDRGIRVAREHPYYRMLNERPNRYMSATVFWAFMELCRNHFGNGYALIDTSNPDNPQLWPLNPEYVRVYYDDARRLDKVVDVYYQYSTKDGTIVLGSEEVLHFKSFNTLDGLVGISVREQLLSTIQGNVKAQALLNRMYDNGMTAKAVLNYTGSLNDANVTTLIAQVKEYIKSSDKKSVESIIPMPVGMSLTPLNLKLADSQFLEIKQYTALQIASAFGVKPYQVGDYTKSSYASAEAQQLSFLVDTLLYIVKHYEEEIGYKLLSANEEKDGYHVKFNTAVLLRADLKTQIEALSQAVNSFLYTPNEAREFLDKPAVEGGDKLLGNGASIPVDFTGAQYTQNNGKEEDKAWLKEILTETLKEMHQAS
jgi:HK97 family phage portal protein